MTRCQVHLTVAIDFLCDDCYRVLYEYAQSQVAICGTSPLADSMYTKLGEARSWKAYEQILKRLDACCMHK